MVRNKEGDALQYRFTALDDAVAQWRQRLVTVPPALRKEFQQRLLISLIHHDAALEGDVLSYSEIKAAIDPSIISDSSLIPSYEQVERYHAACLLIYETAAARQRDFTLETVRAIHACLAPEDAAQGYPYRQENPLHRLYYHDIASPEAIEDEVQAFGEWLANPARENAHVIERVAETHFRLMAIFPWVKQSGRCARLVSNMLLVQNDYPMAVLHSIDRQAYYEALREGPNALIPLYIEAIETTALSEVRVYDQALQQAPRLRAS